MTWRSGPTRMTAEQREKFSRRERWSAKGRARVSHPAHGSVVVPCGSPYAALLCAADVWDCNWMEIRNAEVWAAEPGEATAKMPIHYNK